MNPIDIIGIVPEILQYFVPGYLFITIFKFVSSNKVPDSIRTILSCVISFIIIMLVNLIFKNISFWLAALIACAIALLFALIIGTIYSSNWFKNIWVNCFHKSPSHSIWETILDLNNGTNLKVQIKGEPYYIIGHYKAIEIKDGDFWIALYSYMKYDKVTDKKIVDYSKYSKFYITFNSRDINTIEIFNT